MRRANYEIVERRRDRLVIRDVGPWDQFATVTNAAEYVADELWGLAELFDGMRLFYYDSEGEPTEILLDESCNFRGFAPATEAQLAGN